MPKSTHDSIPRLRREKSYADSRPGFFARLRIRKKLLVLHTVFSLGLAAIMLLVLRPTVGAVVDAAERAEVRALAAVAPPDLVNTQNEISPGVIVRSSAAGESGLTASQLEKVLEASGGVIELPRAAGRARAASAQVAADGGVWIVLVEARDEQVRSAVSRLYGLVTLALLAVYGLVVLALEFLVLPEHVYGPIRRMLEADSAVQHGRTEDELIPEAGMPTDELGEIMRSRNRSIEKIRSQERALASAFSELERTAADLKGKNHLLERARQNLADADRLASLGMMSAGIAHELNTPLAVLKGIAEKLQRSPAGVSQRERDLMVRVIGRLEGLGESLLDFARVRPPELECTQLHRCIEEAITLVRLDREPEGVLMNNRAPEDLLVDCDASRIVQVLVNLIRNAVDALLEDPRQDRPAPEIEVSAQTIERDGASWVSLKIRDSGPGIPPDVLNTIFDPFVSTRLDSRGTGLGLAVADGIVREHGGVLLARNREAGGAELEMLLPAGRPAPDRDEPESMTKEARDHDG